MNVSKPLAAAYGVLTTALITSGAYFAIATHSDAVRQRDEAFYQLELLGQEPCGGVIKLYDIFGDSPRLVQTQEYRFPVQPVGSVR